MMSVSSLYTIVWGVIDAINQTEGLAYTFPDQDCQQEIAHGFQRKSGAGFDNVIRAIDSLVICTIMPPLTLCRELECGQTSFHNCRKDKYGLNLQAIFDHTLRIIWAEIKWPAATSDYMAWVPSSLCMAL